MRRGQQPAKGKGGCLPNNSGSTVDDPLVLSRRLQDRIAKLCAEAVESTDPAKLSELLPELRTALHEQVERMREFGTKGPTQPERRKSQGADSSPMVQ
jgi:hypothetical protein